MSKISKQPLMKCPSFVKSEAEKKLFEKFRFHDDYKNKSEIELKEDLRSLGRGASYMDKFFDIKKLEHFNATENSTNKYDWKVSLLLCGRDPCTSCIRPIMDWDIEKDSLSKLLEKYKKLPFEQGLIHIALQVGNVVLEWNPTSICVPQDAHQFKARKPIDIDFIIDYHATRELIVLMCEEIVEWNINKKYSDNCNCQDFVDALLPCLGLNAMFQGALGGFFKKLQSSINDDDITFSYPPNDSTSLVVFPTHKELDDSMNAAKVDQKKDKKKWQILKLYDSIFWIRAKVAAYQWEMKDKNVPDLMIYSRFARYQGNDKCPFGDPFAKI